MSHRAALLFLLASEEIHLRQCAERFPQYPAAAEAVRVAEHLRQSSEVLTALTGGETE